MRYLARLKKDLLWGVDRHAISAEQAEALYREIEGREAGHRLSAALFLAITAGLCVAAGMALIISHNWDKLPDFGKVFGFLALTTAIGGSSLWAERRGLGGDLPLRVLWFFLPIIGIGLYAQVFQLSGDPARPYLVWLALALPLAWLRPRALATLHVVLCLAVLFRFTLDSPSMLALVQPYKGSPASGSAWIYTGILWAVLVAESKFRMSQEYRSFLCGAGLVWLNGLLWSKTAFHIESGTGFLLAGTASAILWLALDAAGRLGVHSRKLPYVAWIGALYVMTFLWHQRLPERRDISVAAWSLIVALVLGATTAVAFLPKGALSPVRRWQQLGQGLLVASLVLAASSLWAGSELGYKSLGLLANLLLVGTGVALLWHGSILMNRAQVNYGFAILFLLIVTRFIDVLGSLVQGGVAFVMAGIVLAGLAYFFQRSRQAIFHRMEEGRVS